MSRLFEKKASLPIDRLAQYWARELHGPETTPEQFKNELLHELMENAVNGLFDDAGPQVNGKRLGLRILAA
jgi:hypothetical protein